MSRREPRSIRAAIAMPPPPPSKCAKVLYYTWKLCSVVFSHLVMISLVVAYCILGAVTFEKLEAEHEREVKRNISHIRSNTTQSIWGMTRSVPLLNQTNWTSEVVDMLKDFENSLLLEMKVRGWDGNESTDHIQWTFTGALFYSIIVITTIGYGHITPRTQTGKVVTIFYAILGIPLMLLCLSNIGDVLASSFRFLYWRVCCYVCTRPPKRRRRQHPAVRRSVRGRTASTRRRRPPPPPPPAPAQLERAHSDTDFRYRDSGYSSGRARRGGRAQAHLRGAPPGGRTRSQPPSYMYGDARDYEPEDRSPVQCERSARDDHAQDIEDFPKIALPLQDLAAALKDLDNHQHLHSKMDLRSKSLPRPAKKSDYGPMRDVTNTRHYDVEDKDSNVFEMHDLHDVDYENFKERKALEERDERRERRGVGVGEYEYEPPSRDQGYDPEDEDFEFDTPRHRRTWDDRRKERGRSMYERDREDLGGSRGQRARSAVYDYAHRWDDRHERERDKRWPDPEEGRGRRLRRLQTIDDSRPGYNSRYSPSPVDDEWSDEEVIVSRRGKAWNSRQINVYPVPEPIAREEVKIKPVPIWLCVFLVASYIVAGTFLFKRWESWAYLDAAYFCFITLTTIGFGDFVPAQGQSEQAGDATTAVHSIALCSLYLLFGIALLAMSFNLVQEEVRANVASLATKLGIIKSQRPDDDGDESDY